MSEYEFTLKFKLPCPESNPEDYIEALGEAGCDDALVGIGHTGYIILDFIREAESVEEAIYSAITDVRTAIEGSVLIEASPDYVGLTDIANMLSVTRQYVRKLKEENSGAFPVPVHEGRSAIYHLSEVVKFVLRYNTKREIDKSLQEVAALNMRLNVLRQVKTIASSSKENEYCVGLTIPKEIQDILEYNPQLVR